MATGIRTQPQFVLQVQQWQLSHDVIPTLITFYIVQFKVHDLQWNDTRVTCSTHNEYSFAMNMVVAQNQHPLLIQTSTSQQDMQPMVVAHQGKYLREVGCLQKMMQNWSTSHTVATISREKRLSSPRDSLMTMIRPFGDRMRSLQFTQIQASLTNEPYPSTLCSIPPPHLVMKVPSRDKGRRGRGRGGEGGVGEERRGRGRGRNDKRMKKKCISQERNTRGLVPAMQLRTGCRNDKTHSHVNNGMPRWM